MAYRFYLDVQIPDDDERFYFWVDTWKNFYDNVSCIIIHQALVLTLRFITGIFVELS